MGKHSLIFAMVLGFSSLAACEDEDDGTPTGATCPSGSTLTYNNFGKDFFATYCLDCHSSAVSGKDRLDAPAGSNFDTLAEIVAQKHDIDGRAAAGPKATNTNMPDSDASVPTQEERLKLGEWLSCGAPEGTAATP